MKLFPETSKLSRRVVASLATLAAVACGTAVAGCLPKNESQPGVASVESRFGQALREVFGTDVDVECGELPPSGRPDGGIVYGMAYTEDDEYTGKIRLAPVVCSLSGSIIDRTEKLSNKEILDAAFVLSVVVHEGVHVASGNPKQSESDVNCKTVQRGYQVAKSLGAADEPAAQAQKEMTRQARHSEGEWTLADYQVTERCHDGGKLDMNPDVFSPLIFPYLPPIKE